jgi:sigma-B regulation protein RsbU (phosphoserine phosphatase)
VKTHWPDFQREAGYSFASFAPELPPGTPEELGPGRVYRFAKALFFHLTPARRAILLLALVLQLSSLILSSDSAQWVSTNRTLLSSLCLLVLLALELADRVALKRDLRLAREIQAWLVPQSPPQYPHLDIAFRTRPANTVAGDYYDVLPLPGTGGSNPAVLLVVADVAGKGIPAGLLTACFRSSLRTLTDTTQDLRDLVDRLSRFCCSDSNGGRHFTSAFLAKYDDATRSLCYVNAGHNPPLLRRASGSIERLDATGIPFGMFRTATYEVGQISVEPGDLLLIYTDGVVEAVNEAGDEYGFDRLHSFVGETPGSSAEFQQQLLDSIERFTAGAPQYDDITCLIVRFSGAVNPAA